MLFSGTRRVPVDVQYLTCQQNEGTLLNASCPPEQSFYGVPDGKSSLVAASRQAALLQGQCQITEATSLVQVKQTTSLRKIPVTVCAICTSIAFKKDSRHWEVVLLLPLYHQEKSIILSIDIVSINSRILMWNSRDQRALGSGSTERDLA